MMATRLIQLHHIANKAWPKSAHRDNAEFFGGQRENPLLG